MTPELVLRYIHFISILGIAGTVATGQYDQYEYDDMFHLDNDLF